ncbi:MAG TPA: hypothetical protein VL588_03885 [Bdellovibrionota bacterium]|jgi:hypothetical protein|nr:hypothetical protein [Bdellovibrionota bacterium]
MSKLFSFAAAMAVALGVQPAFAGTHYTPMIEVGGGAASGITPEGLSEADLLVHVGFSAYDQGTVDTQGGGGFGPLGFYIVKIKADAQFNVHSWDQNPTYLDVSITPIGEQLQVSNVGDHLVVLGLDLLPVDLTRNVYIDNMFGAQVHILGAHLGNQWNISDKFAFYADITGKLLGYKFRMHVNNALDNFNGASIADLGVQVGMLMKFGEVHMRLFGGVDSDIALGAAHGDFGVSLDPTAYGGLAVDLGDLIHKALPWVNGMEFFVKAAYTAAIDSANDESVGSAVFLGGFTIRF